MVTRSRQLGIQLAVLILFFAGGHLLLADNSQADSLLRQGKVDEATAALKQTLAGRPNDASAHQLLCRVFYAQDIAEQAVHECELASATAPNDSQNQLWLGRAYGLKAMHANPLNAMVEAKKVHTAFERAIQLDPNNVAAFSDLGEFYVAAPALVGGGLDKARALAGRMQQRFPAQAHRLLALIAEKKKDLATAEAEFQQAVAAGRTPEAYIDLGFFYQRQNQTDKVLEPIQAGINADRRKDAVLVDAASILTTAKISPQLAENALREYLSSPSKSDEAPAFKVHLQLGNLLSQTGDTAGAHREYAAAVALASNYAPARKALQGS
jgi:tetratricopeptide (TPR) repeat protein